MGGRYSPTAGSARVAQTVGTTLGDVGGATDKAGRPPDENVHGTVLYPGKAANLKACMRSDFCIGGPEAKGEAGSGTHQRLSFS
jgi:hypothetical protein